MKKIIIGKIFFLCLLFPSLIGASSTCYVFTIPKSGTHLAHKLFSTTPGLLKGKQFIIGHMYKYITNKLSNKTPTLLWIRDPRDALVSEIFYISKMRAGHPSDPWFSYSFDEQLTRVIHRRIGHNILRNWEEFEEIITHHNPKKYCIVRYENLVGAKGGGSDQAQLKEVRKNFHFFDF